MLALFAIIRTRLDKLDATLAQTSSLWELSVLGVLARQLGSNIEPVLSSGPRRYHQNIMQ